MTSYWWEALKRNLKYIGLVGIPRREAKKIKYWNSKILIGLSFPFFPKQGWRLLTKPDSLLTTLLRGKYFKDQDFWDAKSGHNLSRSWRSILDARNIHLHKVSWEVNSKLIS